MKEFLVFGYSFIQNNNIFTEIVEIILDILNNPKDYENEFYNGNRLTEMKALYIASIINPKIFNLLPVLPDKEVVFDPGSYGQYLGGVHYKRFSKRYTNSEHIVGKSLINNEIFVKNKDRRPEIIKNEKSYDLVNLHVHKKILKSFNQRNLFGKQDKKQALFILQNYFGKYFRYSSYPYFTGDTLRNYAQHIYDETTLMDPDQVMKKDKVLSKEITLKPILIKFIH